MENMWHYYSLDRTRLHAPNRKQSPGGRKIRAQHLVEHLLIEVFIVVGDACPLLQERQDGPKEAPGILSKGAALFRVPLIFQHMETRLHLLEPLPLK